MITGLAVEAAARDARQQVLAFAARQLGCVPDDITLEGWLVRHGGDCIRSNR